MGVRDTGISPLQSELFTTKTKVKQSYHHVCQQCTLGLGNDHFYNFYSVHLIYCSFDSRDEINMNYTN